MGRASAADVNRSLEDVDPGVRRRACEVAVTTAGADLGPVLADRDPEVAEAAAWAAGERGPASRALVGDLTAMAVDHGDPLCREAAVAALGAIGDRAGLAAILAATGDKPAVRRRAVIALAAFEGSDVDEALRRALADRDWQVRQAAEDLLDVRPGEGGTS
jgi:HEAT repeat protein